MKKNMGSVDKTLRIIVGLAIILIGYLNNSWWGAIGIVPILTSFISWCPFYVPLGISTNSKTKDS